MSDPDFDLDPYGYREPEDSGLTALIFMALFVFIMLYGLPEFMREIMSPVVR